MLSLLYVCIIICDGSYAMEACLQICVRASSDHSFSSLLALTKDLHGLNVQRGQAGEILIFYLVLRDMIESGDYIVVPHPNLIRVVVSKEGSGPPV